ncbi:hypothetical protein TRIUR3_35430 [Triticum urartu]|uniref:Uncharacterized protein n=1 Tax=Triticum urartu TaxID=4572 RepID=M7YFB5_TRIUA|nr:hypothetical protein TRIUR3_35430 [Triticum urartu]
MTYDILRRSPISDLPSPPPSHSHQVAADPCATSALRHHSYDAASRQSPPAPRHPAVVKVVSIQQHAGIPIITFRGVIAQAQYGAGKTSMISLFVCQVIETNVHKKKSFKRALVKKILQGHLKE